MPKNYVCGIVFDPAQRDEAFTLQFRALARNSKPLRIHVDGWLWILHQRAFPAPIAKIGCCAGVNVVVRRVRFAFSQNDPHQIVRVGTVITFLHRRRNLVVWLGDAMSRIHSPGVIAESAKRLNVGHRKNKHCTRSEFTPWCVSGWDRKWPSTCCISLRRKRRPSSLGRWQAWCEENLSPRQ